MKNCILFSFFLLMLFACNSLDEKHADDILFTIDQKDKNFENIEKDTMIFAVADFFIHQDSKEKAALACYYSGRLYQTRNEFDKAMEAYLKAETYAKNLNDYELLGSISYFMGILYYYHNYLPEAREKLATSLELTKEYTDNYKREISIQITLGNSYQIKNITDSAIIYFENALILADKHQDLTSLASINENLSVSYRKKNNFQQAIYYLQTSIRLNDNPTSRQYLNLAKIYNDINENDSAYTYAIKALDILPSGNTNNIQSNIYNFLSKLEESNKNYPEALDFKNKYIKYYSSMLEEKRDSEIKAIENKYNYEQTLNRNNQLLIEKQNNSLTILLLTLSIIIIFFYSYWRHTKEKSRTMELELIALEAEQKYRAIQSMAESFDEKERSLRTAVLSHYDILKKIALLQEDHQLNDKTHYKRSPLERINAIVYGNNKPNWDLFFDSIKNFYGEIIEKINTHFPDLDKLERNICYLSYIEFTNSEMATLLGYTLNTIAKKKSTLRKKIGMSDRGNIKNHLDFYFQKLNN